MTDTLTGACGCGAVTFAIDASPVGASYCHCTRCQRRSGTAASVQIQLAPGSFRVLTGADQLAAWRPDPGFEKWFCGACGSALYSRNPADHEQIAVRMGALDNDPGIRPALRQFVTYAAAWEPIPDDGLPRYPERRPA